MTSMSPLFLPHSAHLIIGGDNEGLFMISEEFSHIPLQFYFSSLILPSGLHSFLFYITSPAFFLCWRASLIFHSYIRTMVPSSRIWKLHSPHSAHKPYNLEKKVRRIIKGITLLISISKLENVRWKGIKLLVHPKFFRESFMLPTMEFSA